MSIKNIVISIVFAIAFSTGCDYQFSVDVGEEGIFYSLDDLRNMCPALAIGSEYIGNRSVNLRHFYPTAVYVCSEMSDEDLIELMSVYSN